MDNEAMDEMRTAAILQLLLCLLCGLWLRCILSAGLFCSLFIADYLVNFNVVLGAFFVFASYIRLLYWMSII